MRSQDPPSTIALSQHTVSALVIFLDHIQELLPPGEANRTQEWIEDLGKKLDAVHKGSVDRVTQRAQHQTP